jgi:hypothetical protein
MMPTTNNPFGILMPGATTNESHYRSKLKIAGVWKIVDGVVFFGNDDALQYAKDLFDSEFSAEDYGTETTYSAATHAYVGFRNARPLKDLP